MERNHISLILLFLSLSTTIFSQIQQDTIALRSSYNYGKSVAVFGGSVSAIPASDTAKGLWEQRLGMTITNYGVPGAGFSSLQGKSMR